MRFVHRDAGVERELEVRLGRPDAVVGDLAAALGAPGGRLFVDGRETLPGTPLTGSGLVMGAQVELVSRAGRGSGPGPGSWGDVERAASVNTESADTASANAESTRTVSSRTAVIDPGAVLRIIGGLDAGLSAALAPGRFRLGRGEEADIRVACRDVSRLHCEIDVDERGGVTVTDLGSSNGTDVNGTRLTAPARIGPHDVVCAAGRVPFRVLPADALEPVQHIDPAREAGPAGTLPFNRPPRVAGPAASPPIRLPEPPRRTEGQPLRISALITPLVLAGAMVLVLKDPAYALIALFSPLIMLGTMIEDRAKGRLSLRRGKREYAARLAGAREQLAARRAQQIARLHAQFPDPAELCHRASAPGLRLWERRRGAADFLHVSAGLADQRWTPPVERGRRGEHEIDDTLAAALAAAQELPQVPVAVDLRGGGVLGLEGDRAAALAAARSLLCQAVTASGPADVAVAVFVDEDRVADWDWTKWLPHGADSRSGSSRLVAVGAERCEALARSLLSEFGAAGTGREADQNTAGTPVLLAVVDGATLLEGRPCALRDLLGGRAGQVAGIVLAGRLPALCTEVLSVTADGSGRLRRVATGERVDDILVAGLARRRARALARALARFEDPETRAEGAGLPDRVGLLPLLELSGPLDAAVAGRWRSAARTLRVRAVLGVTERDVFQVDLDDDGPHALIAGTTGSGKSELLRTLIASMAVGADPEHLTFALVDYKGGGALDECARLPHVVGLVTDLDEQLGERALRCLEAELRYREHALRRAGTSHVRDYQRLRDTRRPDLEPMPRLVVVIDEFATLVRALPQFVDALVSVAQRGRSLGMHLIMATQRPSGSVSDAIKNNVKLRLALRLESAADSQDVIDSPAAASIGSRQWGRGFYRVSASEVLPVQTALSTGVTPSAAAAGAVSLLPFRLTSGERAGLAPPASGSGPPARAAGAPVAAGSAATEDLPSDLTRLVEAARKAGAAAGIVPPRRPWPDPLPSAVPLRALSDPRLGPAARALQTEATGLPAFALADDPDRQAQYPVGWDPAAGNMLIYGAVGAGASTTLAALALAEAAALPPDRLHLYVLDMGSGDLAPLQGLAHTGAYVGAAERARQIRLIRLLRRELDLRKAGGVVRGAMAGGPAVQGPATQGPATQGSAMAGDPGAPRPGAQGVTAAAPARWLVLIDNVGSLRSELEKDFAGLGVLDELERIFADGPAVGLHIIATGDRAGAIPSAWVALSRQKLLLRLADASEYSSFDIPRNAVPGYVPGRALVVATRQVVQVGHPGPELTSAVAEIAQLRPGAQRTAYPVVLLPELITADQLRGSGAVATTGPEPWCIPVGFTDSNLAPAALRLYEHEHALIAGPPRSGRSSALLAIAATVLGAVDPPTVVAFAPRRSPLRDLTAPVVVCCDYAELERTLDPFTGRTLLLVDDAETVPDTLGVIDRWIAKAGAGRHVIAAGRNDGVRRQYGMWTQRVRDGRCGVLLVPDHELDGDLLGVALPRQHRMAPVPGRGYLVSDGALDGVQLALVTAPGGAGKTVAGGRRGGSAYNDRGSDEINRSLDDRRGGPA
ncbi:FHA domain-containing protein [Actinocrinis puniceicyclus]|uniref:FHA domain-containing protein n=1 Tax=Actinocrinis puniceicyclus TaxID=977794 RepID=A0A8J7WPT2_9ACTN|nr:FtsK/SpoIIIE domain-containing protein [Actinocrinis puniceicyclus]MBS2964610.1 FHA domain-containing protein [Actinocrinis puniceicyclus]